MRVFPNEISDGTLQYILLEKIWNVNLIHFLDEKGDYETQVTIYDICQGQISFFPSHMS